MSEIGGIRGGYLPQGDISLPSNNYPLLRASLGKSEIREELKAYKDMNRSNVGNLSTTSKAGEPPEVSHGTSNVGLDNGKNTDVSLAVGKAIQI